MNVTIAHADTCLPDYWSGHHLPHVQIPVYRNMTLAALRDAIRSEISQCAVMGSTDDARLLGDVPFTTPEQEMRLNKLLSKIYAAINRDVRGAKKGQRVAFRDLEPQGEDDESVYAFFVIVIED